MSKSANYERSGGVRILGIDPGLAVTGYGLIEADSLHKIKLIEAGVIRTSPKNLISQRIEKIYANIKELIEEYSPEILVLEKLYAHYKHPTTAILMAHSRAMACLLAGMYKIRLINYPSTKIKKAITGSGHASKIQVQKMIAEFLKLKNIPEPADVTDALALALGFVYIRLRGF